MESLVIFVCAPQRSGTSCVSGILQNLGVPMGRSWIRANRGNPRGYFEDHGLKRIAWATLAETLDSPKMKHRKLIQMLRRWLAHRSKEGPIIGAKYPALTMAIPHIVQAWPNVRFIVPERDPEACARSMQFGGAKSGWRQLSLEQKTERFRNAIEQRDKHLEELNCTVLRLKFPDFLQQPEATATSILNFCGIQATQKQFQAACQFMNPGFVHF